LPIENAVTGKEDSEEIVIECLELVDFLLVDVYPENRMLPGRINRQRQGQPHIAQANH
jgi:hypothetical protein